MKTDGKGYLNARGKIKMRKFRFSDKEFMLYQAILIWKLNDEIGNTLSLMPKMSQEVKNNIFNHHWCSYNSSNILCEVLERHYPNIYTEKGKSIKQMFDEAEAYLKEIIERLNNGNK